VRIEDRLHQAIEPLSGQTRHGDHRNALELRQLFLGLLAQAADAADLVVEQVPFTTGKNDGAALPLDQIGDALLLLLKGRLGVDQQDDDLGETNGVDRVGNRQLLELFLDARFTAQARSIEQAKIVPLPVEFDRDGVARQAGFRAGQQPIRTEQPVDQGRLAGVRPADNGDADRSVLGCFVGRVLVGLRLRLRHDSA
jgi:hypothetical protein